MEWLHVISVVLTMAGVRKTLKVNTAPHVSRRMKRSTEETNGKMALKIAHQHEEESGNCGRNDRCVRSSRTFTGGFQELKGRNRNFL